MTVIIQDVLKANLVLVGIGLINNPEELERFQNAVNTDVTVTVSGLVMGIPSPVRTLSLNRDRIELELSSARSIIGRDYPSKEDLSRLADVAGYAISETELESQPPRAFGYNIELVYDQDSGQSALSYLAERLFVTDFPSSVGWQLKGGAGKLLFEMGEKQYNITIEPRLNDVTTTRIFFSLNLHSDEQRSPHRDEIEDSLREIWRQAHEFVKRLDEGVR